MAVIEQRRAGAPAPPGPRRDWMRGYVRRLVAADFCCGAVAGVFALDLRFADLLAPFVLPYLLITVALPFVWVSAAALARCYEPRFLGLGSEEFRRVFSAGLLLTTAVAILAYATKTDLARGYVAVALPGMTLLTLAARFALRKRLHRLRRSGRCMRRVVAVGHRDAVRALLRQFRRERHHGMQVVAACLPAGQANPEVGDIDGCPVLGDFGMVTEAVRRAGADTVAVLACPELDGTALRRLTWRLERTGTELCVAPALMEVAGPRTTIRPVAGLPLLHVEHPELAGARKLVKEVVDRIAAVAALALLAPLFAVIAVLVRAGSPGPAFFRQVRVGKDGRLFTLVKFRTMVVGAETLKAELAQRNEHDGVLFKIRRDPRITPVGGWLRRYSLDELPQLCNVALGHMSLVGPRPPLPEEVARYGDDVRRRLVVKPGLTGLWQVSGRSDLSWEESVRLDLRYVENWSLTLDLQILWKTWSAVARGSGAY